MDDLDNELEKMIAKHEGLRLKAYNDILGIPTIGFGRNLGDVGISKEEAIYLLRNDINRCIVELCNHDWYLTQPQGVKKALINMCFNMGINRLLKFKKMIACLQSKDYTKAAIEALDSKWAQQVGGRAKDVALMIREGK